MKEQNRGWKHALLIWSFTSFFLVKRFEVSARYMKDVQGFQIRSPDTGPMVSTLEQSFDRRHDLLSGFFKQCPRSPCSSYEEEELMPKSAERGVCCV